MGFFFYILTTMPAPAVCLVCGTTFADALQPCPNCGHYPTLGRASAAIKRTYSGLLFSLTKAPVEQARTTAKHLIAGLVAAALFGLVALSATHGCSGFFGLMVSLSIAGAWVMLAWWVYLDATWRTDGRCPVGLADADHYRCGARDLSGHPLPGTSRVPELRREAAHRAQALPLLRGGGRADLPPVPVSGQARLGLLPGLRNAVERRSRRRPAQTPGCPAPAALLSVTGTVADASTSCPIEGAEVKIDSREGGASTLTDAAGRYTLAGLTPGPYVLVASLPGYVSEAKPYSPTPTGAGPVHFSLYPARDP